jgi:hypothetical protein
VSERDATDAEFRDALSGKISDIDIGPDRTALTLTLHRFAAIPGRMFMLEDDGAIRWFRIASVGKPDTDGAVRATLEPVSNP